MEKNIRGIQNTREIRIPDGMVADVGMETVPSRKVLPLTRIIDSGLTPRQIKKIKKQIQKGTYPEIAGRAWWFSVFNREELEQAGLGTPPKYKNK